MELTFSEIRNGAELGARMATGATRLIAEDNLRTALGITAIVVTGLATAVIYRQPLDASSLGTFGAAAASLHSSWSHFYAPALPCPAGRISGRAIGSWTSYIVDCYFPGMRQRLAKVRGVKG